MPELPEVETIRRGLEGLLVGARLAAVEVRDPRLLRDCPLPDLEGLRGKALERVARRGKFLILDFSGLALVIHLRMTGRLLPQEEGHTRLVLGFSDGKRLVLDDPRRFATLHCVRAERLEEFEPLRRLGLEPFTASYTLGNFQKLLQTKQEIKRLLLDQRKLAGLGNIYANEALFRAGIHPQRRADSLSLEEAQRLFEAIPQLLEEAIALQGTTISDYRTATGDSGSFQLFLKVYGRGGEPCPRCGAPIEQTSQGGRSTYFCSECQPEHHGSV
ncbi:MAG: bifunctional DNA-formamidopyrimidine glycosylase/DNA-(apurinic or apyrimidinic site) lyase [Candidatus Acetothermia bacterium]|jgi:formamidopyrimidine-DNA glycosylase|nr:bifunctional DNA-formamidopyrimidine glycosylase/DNA-(apurinic or apyrimidinic site) lyase [Candidatus Acetothermia bacterium]MDH7504647.1 bifunctional DNA-formamidopyrimidine glycosylase/DNA-(apurinic or apyrimidinic site) lyase [Candidatus Acetothermia bacterium]